MNPCIFLVAVSIYCSGLVQSSHAKPNATNSTFLFSGTNQTADDTNSFDGHLMRNAQHDNYQFTKWPNGIVPYAFDYTTLNQNEVNIIKNALKKFQVALRNKKTGKDCIKFVPWNNHRNWATYKKHPTGCNSWVGMSRNPGSQVINLAGGCIIDGGVFHETMHCLGFDHEHNRYDRDNYLTVYLNNVAPENRFAFDKKGAGYDTQGFPYDYNSIMHYESTAFTMNGQQTMVPKVPGVVLRGATEKTLTKSDIARIRKFYKCT